MRHYGSEILLDNLREFLQPAVHIKEQDSLFFEVFSDGVVNGFRLVLSGDSAEPFLLSFWDSQTIERVFDVFWNIIPVVLS